MVKWRNTGIIRDLTYLLIALFVLNKFRIFFHGTLDGSLSRRAPLLTRVDFELFLRFCNFPWLLLPSDTSSNCFVLLGLKTIFIGYDERITCAADGSSSFVGAYVWFIVWPIWVLIGSLKGSLVRIARKRLTIYKPSVSLEDRRVNVSRSQTLFAFSANSHTLRTFAPHFSNIDFFLEILPLKDDELVKCEKNGGSPTSFWRELARKNTQNL